MATFRVGFDGRWQENFDTYADAVDWAREVSLTGRTTYVVERRGRRHRFRIGFPAEEAETAWKGWRGGAWFTGP